MAARMIPSLDPAKHDAWSREDEIYHALRKLLDDFTVTHSYKTLKVVDENAVEQKGADSVVFNRKLERLAVSTESGSTRVAIP